MYTIPGRSYQLWSPVTAEIEPFEYMYIVWCLWRELGVWLTLVWLKGESTFATSNVHCSVDRGSGNTKSIECATVPADW